MRLFEKDELASMMEQSGFRIGSVFGNYTAAPLTDESPRVIIFGVHL